MKLWNKRSYVIEQMKNNNFMVVINQVLVPLCKDYKLLPSQMVVIFKIRILFFFTGSTRASSFTVE